MDIVDFFIKITKLIPTEDQKHLLEDLVKIDVKRILICAARQTGKTLCCAVAVLWLAFEFDETVKILLVAQGTSGDPPIYQKIKELFRLNRNIFFEKVIIVNKYEDLPKYGFETKKGSYIHCKNATEGQVRGVTADWVFIDEAGIIRDDVILSAFDCKSGKWSKFICLSTPPEKANLFTTWGDKSEQLEFKVYNWSEIGLPWHSESDLHFKETQYSSQRYKREVLGLFLSREERAFFPSKNIDKCVIDCPPEREGGLKSTVEVGLDLGYETTALMITERFTQGDISKRKLLFRKIWHEKPIESIAEEIVEIIANFKASIVKVDSKLTMTTISKGYLEKYAKFPIHYIDFKLYKKEMMSQMQRRVRETRLIIPDHFTDVIIQMRGYRLGMDRRDDMVDALALSCYEPTTPFTTRPIGNMFISGNSKKNVWER